MSSIDRVFGVKCSSCQESLIAPIVTTDCLHHMHQRCLEALSNRANQCPECNHKILSATANPALGDLVEKMDQVAQKALKDHSNEPKIDIILHQAIKDGEIDVVAILLSSGAASPSALVKGKTPLYVACEAGNVDIAKLLLQKGAQVSQKNDLSYKAKYDKYWSVNDFDCTHGSLPMKAAIKSGSLELVELLIEHGADFDGVGNLGRSPLMEALHAGKEDLALLFIEKGANLRLKEAMGCNVIHFAVDHIRVLRELVKRGVGLNDIDQDGQTVLYTVAGRKSPEILQFVLENSDKKLINQLWLDTWTPLSSAVQSNYLDNVIMLVDAGADLSFNYKGLNILELAHKELRDSEEFYKKNPQYSEEGDRCLPGKRAIVKYLETKVSENYVADENEVIRPLEESRPEESQPMLMATLEDGTEYPEILVKQILFSIQLAVKTAGPVGGVFLLTDLKEKASKKASWKPNCNPFCDTMEIMKAHGLIDGIGEMLPGVRSIIKECILGESFDIKIQIPERWQ